MNKLCGKTPCPIGTVAMKTLASTNNFILVCTVKLEVRSIDRLEQLEGCRYSKAVDIGIVTQPSYDYHDSHTK